MMMLFLLLLLLLNNKIYVAGFTTTTTTTLVKQVTTTTATSRTKLICRRRWRNKNDNNHGNKYKYSNYDSFTSSSSSLYSSSSEEESNSYSSSMISNDDNSNSNGTAVVNLGAWVPVGSVSSLTGITPIRIEIMGHDFVVWDKKQTKTKSEEKTKRNDSNKERQHDHQWSVLLDICPHRFAPLSIGRYNPDTQCIECPYHGWNFDTDGTLTHVPQLDLDTIDGDAAEADNGSSSMPSSLEQLQSKGSATSFPVHVTGDLLWTFLPTSIHGESFPISLLPEQYFSGIASDLNKLDNGIKVIYSSHEMPSSMDITVENGIDPSHFPFSHHGVISKRSDAGPMPDMKTITSNFTHLDIYASYIRNGRKRERLYSFQRPFLLCTQEKDKDDNDRWKQTAKFFMIPVREGRCRIITAVPIFTKKWLPNWISHAFVSRLFIGDLFLHDAERTRQEGIRKYYEPTTADESSRAWNRWHKKFGFANSPPHAFRSASLENLQKLSRREQEDQYLLHTYSCNACRTALKRFRLTRNVAGIVAAVAASILLQQGGGAMATRKIRSILGMIFLGGSMIGGYISNQIVRFHEGSIRPSDTSDRGWSMYQK